MEGNRSTNSRLEKTPPYNNCDVGLGLRMQHQEGTSDEYSSYPSKRVMTSSHFSPFQHLPQHHFGGGSASSDGGGSGGGIGFLVGGPHCFNSTNNPLEGAGERDMRAPFTASQRHELERQNMIFNYLTAYNSVPADVLFPLSRNPTSQTRSSGLDPEPWRCRRTDGKKWRCTKDVAYDKKFCEKHAHKSRARSRKHVENQSKNINYSQQKDATPILENPFSNSSRKDSAMACDQTRSIEWLMKGGPPPTSTISQVSTCTQEQKQQQQVQSSSRRGSSDRDSSSLCLKNPTILEQQENDQDKQGTTHWNPFMGNDYYPYFDPKVMTSSSQSSPTRHFIDAWPSNGIGNKGSFSFSSGSRELPLSSLTLSVSGGDGVVEESEAEAMKPQWMMSNISWLNSTGGPLGEALCHGNSGTGKGTSDLPSPHGCSNSSNTTSSCSKGSCEEGNHQFNFFG